MGLYATASRIWPSSKYQVSQLDNVLEKGQVYQGYDGFFIPRIGHTKGDLDVHDLAVEAGTRRIVFIGSPFISGMVNEDRCHLNGLALVAGKPRYVTACSQSDVVDGLARPSGSAAASLTSPPTASSPGGCRCRILPASTGANYGC